MKKSKEQELFELVESIGEILEGDLHILIQTPDYPEHEEARQFRIYHKKGYCLDLYKQVEDEDENTGDPVKWYYGFHAEWQGFDKINVEGAIKLIKKEMKAYGKR